MQATIDDLLGMSDFDLVNGVSVRLEQAAEAIGKSPSREQEFVILFTTGAAGVIGNGGFLYLFEGMFLDEDPGLAKTIAAFEALGVEDACTAFREALAHFPDGCPPDDGEERTKLYRAVPEEGRDRLDKLVWRSKETLYRQLAKYVRANKVAIEEILSDYQNRRRELEDAPFTVDTSWDVGDQPIQEIMAGLLLRLCVLPPGGVLALVAHHPGDKFGPPDEGGEVDISTEDWLRQFCGRAGHVLVRVEPPCYWIRRRGGES